MDDAISRLTLILDSEEDLYRRLRELLHREREVLARLDADELTRIVREKEELGDEGRLLEQTRIGAAADLARALGIDEARPRLSTLCERVGPGARDLRASHNRLVVMMGVVRELLEENAVLARDSLSQVRGTMQLLGGLVTREPCYDSHASEPRASAGQLVRQSA